MECIPIISVDDVGSYHKIMFVIYSSLNVVSHLDYLSLDEQSFGIKVGGADLCFTALAEFFLKELVIDFTVFEVLDFLFDELYALLGKFEAIGLVELLEVFFEFLFDVAEVSIYFILAVVVFLAIGSSEFATIDSNGFSADETYIMKEDGVKFKAVFESFWVVFPKACTELVEVSAMEW